jgi:hypothetical protein
MPEPDKARPQNFADHTVLYDDGDFAVAVGTWQPDQSTRVAMRWNGEGDGAGYPSQGRNPLWFQLPQYLAVPLLAALIERDGARNKEMVSALQALTSS